MRAEPSTIAFAVHEHEPPALEVRINFGIFAGREATPAEIDELATQVLEKVGSVSIVHAASSTQTATNTSFLTVTTIPPSATYLSYLDL